MPSKPEGRGTERYTPPQNHDEDAAEHGREWDVEADADGFDDDFIDRMPQTD